MKKIILGALVLAGVVTSCTKEEITIEETAVEETVAQNENTRDCFECILNNYVYLNSMDEWLMLNSVMYEGGGVMKPDNDAQSVFADNQAELAPVLGEERVNNVVEGIWTVIGSGDLEYDSVFTLKFLENGQAVEILEIITLVK